MSNEQKLLHVALEAINSLMAGAERYSDNEWGRICMPTNSAMSKGADAVMAIRQALAKPSQEPAVPQGEPFGYFRVDALGWTDCAATDEGAIALYERPAAPAVPQGWKLVPIEPTPEMGRAYLEAAKIHAAEGAEDKMRFSPGGYAAMLSAAPSQEPYKDSTPHLSEKEALR